VSDTLISEFTPVSFIMSVSVTVCALVSFMYYGYLGIVRVRKNFPSC
jgi:hypothetical protein